MSLILSTADVVAMAHTGSGIWALILSPTRDLTLQTFKFTNELGRFIRGFSINFCFMFFE